jgi:hypothetical protein
MTDSANPPISGGNNSIKVSLYFPGSDGTADSHGLPVAWHESKAYYRPEI